MKWRWLFSGVFLQESFSDFVSKIGKREWLETEHGQSDVKIAQRVSWPMSTNWGVNGVIVLFCGGCSHRHLFINSSLPFEWIFQLKRNKAFVFWQRLPIDWMIHSLAGQTDGQTENNLGLLPACFELWHECHATNKWHVFLKCDIPSLQQEMLLV